MGEIVPQERANILSRMMAQYGDALLRTAALYLRDAFLAEDVVQDTFVKAYGALDGFRGESSEKTWLTRILINTCRDALRSRWMRHTDATPLEALPEPAGGQSFPDSTVLDEVMNLPRRWRAVILLRYYQDMTVEETAQALKISPNTVKYQTRRANQCLRERLKGWYYDE